MASQEEFDRIGVRAGDNYASENGRNGRLREEAGVYDAGPIHAASPVDTRDPLPRAIGSPLPAGVAGRPLSGRADSPVGRASVPPPGRALSVQAPAEPEASAMQWLSGVIKQAVPFVQKLLPLLDGQIASAAANLLTARPHTPPPPPLNLQPIENGLADLRSQHTNLKDQIADQNASLKRVEDHLEMVREATDRNTLEQQELIEDLKVISSRMNRMAVLFIALLVISVLLNIVLFLHIQRVLP